MAGLHLFLVRSSAFTIFALFFYNASGFFSFICSLRSHAFSGKLYVKMNLYTALNCHRVSYFSIVIYAGTQSVCICFSFLVLLLFSQLSQALIENIDSDGDLSPLFLSLVIQYGIRVIYQINYNWCLVLFGKAFLFAAIRC